MILSIYKHDDFSDHYCLATISGILPLRTFANELRARDAKVVIKFPNEERRRADLKERKNTEASRRYVIRKFVPPVHPHRPRPRK